MSPLFGVENRYTLLREALDERNRGCGVLDSHVALVSPVALRWERGTSRRAAAHVGPGQHEAVVDEAPDDGHGRSGWGARAARGVHRHESRQPGVGALDPNARLLPGLRVAFGHRQNHRHAHERLVRVGVRVRVRDGVRVRVRDPVRVRVRVRNPVRLGC